MLFQTANQLFFLLNWKLPYTITLLYRSRHGSAAQKFQYELSFFESHTGAKYISDIFCIKTDLTHLTEDKEPTDLATKET